MQVLGDQVPPVQHVLPLLLLAPHQHLLCQRCKAASLLQTRKTMQHPVQAACQHSEDATLHAVAGSQGYAVALLVPTTTQEVHKLQNLWAKQSFAMLQTISTIDLPSPRTLTKADQAAMPCLRYSCRQ